MSGQNPNNDPLAELARLIGQDDPFRNARPAPRRESSPQPYAEAPASAPDWLARRGGTDAHDAPSVASPAHYDDAHYEQDARFAPRAPQPRYEEAPRYDEPHQDAAYRDGAHHDNADGYEAADYDAAYDPAHSDHADHYYADDGHPQNYNEVDEQPARRRNGLVTVAAVLGMALLGTGGVFAYRAITGTTGSSGQPPVIKAQDVPIKVVPPQTADNQPVKQIYDRVNDKGGNDKLGTYQEEPLDVKGGTAPRGIPGLIASVPPGGVAPAPPATQPAATPPNEPKRVKTVPIRPDQTTGTTVAPTTRPPAATAPPPTRMSNNQPQTPPARNPVVSGGFVVQVASQRSEADAQASFRSLQAKYPDVLGGREAIIRKADLGEKGTFYRAQIGPFTTMDQAKEMCSSLQAAGGQCVVQKN
jgi:cell division protein FtsN